MKAIKEYKTDVLVAGGGPAGVAAAISAARCGAKVTLIERSGFLGGTAITGLCLHTFHNAKGEKVVSGFPEELIDRLKEIGGTIGPVEIKNAHMRTTTPIDHELMKYLLIKLMDENKVELLLHSFASDVLTEGNKIETVIVETKSERRKIKADVVIDATGDGDIAAWAGVPYKKGREIDGLMQAMSLVYKMINVNLDKALEHIGKGTAYIEKGDEGKICMWFSADLDNYKDHVEEEKLFPYSHHMFWGNSFHKGDVNLNITRIIELDPTDADELTRAEMDARYQVYRTSEFLKKYVPGFEDAYVVSSSPFIGIRETRRIMGEYVLTEEDVVNGRKFDDGITRCAYPVDVHDPKGTGTVFAQVKNSYYEIPYRCLLPLNVDNLVVAGRCISTTVRAIASARTMITAMSLGQAAGVAAALSSKDGTLPRKQDVNKVREVLKEQGAML